MPEWNADLRPRLALLRLSPTREAEIVDELSQHLDDRYEQLRVEGAGEDAARRMALEELREHDTIAREMRALRQAHMPAPIADGSPRRGRLRDVGQDLRYAVRMLRKQPGFTAAVVLTLALGIGANTAVFSLVNATLFRHLPVTDPEQLVYTYRGNSGVFSYPQLAMLREHGRSLDLAGWGGIPVSLHGGDSAELVSGLIVTGNFFDVLGVRPALGRLLAPSDDVTPGAHPVVVISHDFWQTRFGARPDVVGREVRLNGHVFTIVGVAPAGFPGPQVSGAVRHIYTPMMMQAIVRPPRAGYSGEQDPDLLRHNTASWIFGIGRLKPGVTSARAKAELDPILAEFFRTRVQLPPGATPPAVTLVPIEDPNVGPRPQMRSAARLVGAAVGTVLLIACANIANLLLSRAAGRRRELAVRLALGASRGRLLQQLLTESVLLSLIGGVAGVALAWGLLQAFAAAAPPASALPLALDFFTMDRRVLLFALLLSTATGIACGVVPALLASRPAMGAALKASGGAGGDATRGFDVKKAFVVAEVALSLLLLVAAGLFVRSLQAARAIDTGIDVDRLITAPLSVDLLRYTRAQGRAFYEQVVDRVQRLPGVESASVARVAVLNGGGRILSVHVEGRPGSHDRVMSEGSAPTGDDRTVINANVVGPRFFRTLGIPLMHGRDFDARDGERAPPVLMLNTTAAQLHFPEGNPIGQRVSVDGPEGPWREVVGIVRDSKYGSLAEGALPVAYLPLAQNHETGVVLYVRAAVPPAGLATALRHEIQQVEPNLPVPDIRTMAETVGTSLYAARMGAWLLSAFGGLALLLAVVGIYGVLSFTIARRTREMGIRLALGAGSRRVFLLVVRDGMWLVGLGAAIGIVAAALGARSLAAFLYGVSPQDLPSFAGAMVLLGVVAFIACAIPARRAIRVDPVTTLRQD